MATCLIGLGSNLGEPSKNLDSAASCLRKWDGTIRLEASEWVQTAPIGGPEGQSTFANGAIRLETDRSPREVLETLLETEQSLGRKRRTRWGPRTVDLDLLLYDDLQMVEDGLTIPHPWMAIRRFVLQPAVQVAPDMIHPDTGWTIKRLWENLQAARYIAIAGVLPGPARQSVVAAAKDAGATLVSEGNSVECPEGTAVKFSPNAKDESKRYFFVSDFWEEKPAVEDPTPNLVIAFSGTESDAEEQSRLFERVRKSGPFLFLDARDTKRLQHDIAAAITGMKPDA